MAYAVIGWVIAQVAEFAFENFGAPDWVLKSLVKEWFSDGLTEEILNALARTPDLLVAARTSSFKYKNSSEDVPTIANALGVAHVLEGSVRTDENRLRVTAQLIRASDGFHLWSENYDRSPEDVIALQEEVAVAIATALETAMDPDALAAMVSSGTSSVEAYNAYLQGLAFGVDTLNTGDSYVFLSARDAFEKAVELDPEFSFAYLELAKFWRVQLQTTNITSGIVDLPSAEMKRLFNGAIEKAIRYERDPVNQTRYRALQALEQNRLQRALLLNTDYLEQRPNDQQAQNIQLNLLVDLQMDAELRKAITTYQERDGYDLVVAQNSMTFSLTTDDADFIRKFAYTALERIGDSPFAKYQAHRALLWARDIDGASKLIREIQASDLPEESRLMVTLRQACAENRLDDAATIYNRIREVFPDETSIIWLSHNIMNRGHEARATLMPLDESNDMDSLSDYLSYAHFDARPFPNLMATLLAEGIEPRQPRELPYSCKI